MISLIKLIEEVIAKPRPKSKTKPKPAFKPSALGTPCLRKLYYSYNRVDEDYEATPALKKYGHMGDDAHDRLSGYLREAGVLIDYYNEKGKPVKRFGKIDLEFPLKDPDLEMSAKIDGVMILPPNELWLGEWKTIGDRGFRGLMQPKPEHQIQGAMYVYGFTRALNEGVYSHIKELEGYTEIKGIRFIYENRDNGQLKEFVVTDSSQIFRQTLNKMAAVKKHIENDELPAKTEDWCRSCPWRDKCAKNYKI